MAWVRIDDGFDDHPKTLHAWSLAPESVGVWPRASAWAAKHLTDGFVTAQYVAGLLPVRRPRDRATAALVEAGLWIPNGTGWQIHDFLDYNESREHAEERRRKDLARKGAAAR